MLNFLVATYNESDEIESLLNSVSYYVDTIIVSDDGSTDNTTDLVNGWSLNNDFDVTVIYNDHTGLPEVVKAKGVDFIRYLIYPNDWVLMLDADERIDEATLKEIEMWLKSPESENITHVWFGLDEYIDGKGPLRSFLKCRLFRANAIRFSNSVHEDDQFDGQGANNNWKVIHRKTSAKQIMREREYLQTYQRLLEEGKVTQEWVDRCKSFHYFVR